MYEINTTDINTDMNRPRYKSRVSRRVLYIGGRKYPSTGALKHYLEHQEIVLRSVLQLH